MSGFLCDHSNADESASNRRRHGRVLCQDVECSLGEVLDLSASGMRIRLRGKPPAIGETFELTLDALDIHLVIPSKVCWVRKAGLLKQDAGIEFAAIDAKTRSSLALLARCAASNETILPEVREARRSAG